MHYMKIISVFIVIASFGIIAEVEQRDSSKWYVNNEYNLSIDDNIKNDEYKEIIHK